MESGGFFIFPGAGYLMRSDNVKKEAVTMMGKENLNGIGLFTLTILHLISLGKSEPLGEVERHFKDKDLIEYLGDKYGDDFYSIFTKTTHSNEQFNQYFYTYANFIEGNENKKYGITGETDGLLLILALLADNIDIPSAKLSAGV